MNLFNKIANQIKDVIKQTDPMATAILYGSRATGKAKKESDWDILILLDKSQISTEDDRSFRHKLYDIELETGESISTLVYTKHDWDTRLSITPLYQAVKKTGIVL